MLLARTAKRKVYHPSARDARLHYIDADENAIRFGKQLMYRGFHLFEDTKPQLAFRAVGRYSYPRMDFLKPVDYLETHAQTRFQAQAAGS